MPRRKGKQSTAPQPVSQTQRPSRRPVDVVSEEELLVGAPTPDSTTQTPDVFAASHSPMRRDGSVLLFTATYPDPDAPRPWMEAQPFREPSPFHSQPITARSAERVESAPDVYAHLPWTTAELEAAGRSIDTFFRQLSREARNDYSTLALLRRALNAHDQESPEKAQDRYWCFRVAQLCYDDEDWELPTDFYPELPVHCNQEALNSSQLFFTPLVLQSQPTKDFLSQVNDHTEHVSQRFTPSEFVSDDFKGTPPLSGNPSFLEAIIYYLHVARPEWVSPELSQVLRSRSWFPVPHLYFPYGSGHRVLEFQKWCERALEPRRVVEDGEVVLLRFQDLPSFQPMGTLLLVDGEYRTDPDGSNGRITEVPRPETRGSAVQALLFDAWQVGFAAINKQRRYLQDHGITPRVAPIPDSSDESEDQDGEVLAADSAVDDVNKVDETVSVTMSDDVLPADVSFGPVERPRDASVPSTSPAFSDASSLTSDEDASAAGESGADATTSAGSSSASSSDSDASVPRRSASTSVVSTSSSSVSTSLSSGASASPHHSAIPLKVVSASKSSSSSSSSTSTSTTSVSSSSSSDTGSSVPAREEDEDAQATPDLGQPPQVRFELPGSDAEEASESSSVTSSAEAQQDIRHEAERAGILLKHSTPTPSFVFEKRPPEDLRDSRAADPVHLHVIAPEKHENPPKGWMMNTDRAAPDEAAPHEPALGVEQPEDLVPSIGPPMSTSIPIPEPVLRPGRPRGSRNVRVGRPGAEEPKQPPPVNRFRKPVASNPPDQPLLPFENPPLTAVAPQQEIQQLPPVPVQDFRHVKYVATTKDQVRHDFRYEDRMAEHDIMVNGSVCRLSGLRIQPDVLFGPGVLLQDLCNGHVHLPNAYNGGILVRSRGQYRTVRMDGPLMRTAGDFTVDANRDMPLPRNWPLPTGSAAYASHVTDVYESQRFCKRGLRARNAAHRIRAEFYGSDLCDSASDEDKSHGAHVGPQPARHHMKNQIAQARAQEADAHRCAGADSDVSAPKCDGSAGPVSSRRRRSGFVNRCIPRKPSLLTRDSSHAAVARRAARLEGKRTLRVEQLRHEQKARRTARRETANVDGAVESNSPSVGSDVAVSDVSSSSAVSGTPLVSDEDGPVKVVRANFEEPDRHRRYPETSHVVLVPDTTIECGDFPPPASPHSQAAWEHRNMARLASHPQYLQPESRLPPRWGPESEDEALEKIDDPLRRRKLMARRRERRDRHGFHRPAGALLRPNPDGVSTRSRLSDDEELQAFHNWRLDAGLTDEDEQLRDDGLNKEAVVVSRNKHGPEVWEEGKPDVLIGDGFLAQQCRMHRAYTRQHQAIVRNWRLPKPSTEQLNKAEDPREWMLSREVNQVPFTAMQGMTPEMRFWMRAVLKPHCAPRRFSAYALFCKSQAMSDLKLMNMRWRLLTREEQKKWEDLAEERNGQTEHYLAVEVFNEAREDIQRRKELISQRLKELAEDQERVERGLPPLDRCPQLDSTINDLTLEVVSTQVNLEGSYAMAQFAGLEDLGEDLANAAEEDKDKRAAALKKLQDEHAARQQELEQLEAEATVYSSKSLRFSDPKANAFRSMVFGRTAAPVPKLFLQKQLKVVTQITRKAAQRFLRRSGEERRRLKVLEQRIRARRKPSAAELAKTPPGPGVFSTDAIAQDGDADPALAALRRRDRAVRAAYHMTARKKLKELKSTILRRQAKWCSSKVVYQPDGQRSGYFRIRDASTILPPHQVAEKDELLRRKLVDEYRRRREQGEYVSYVNGTADVGAREPLEPEVEPGVSSQRPPKVTLTEHRMEALEATVEGKPERKGCDRWLDTVFETHREQITLVARYDYGIEDAAQLSDHELYRRIMRAQPAHTFFHNMDSIRTIPPVEAYLLIRNGQKPTLPIGGASDPYQAEQRWARRAEVERRLWECHNDWMINEEAHAVERVKEFILRRRLLFHHFRRIFVAFCRQIRRQLNWERAQAVHAAREAQAEEQKRRGHVPRDNKKLVDPAKTIPEVTEADVYNNFTVAQNHYLFILQRASLCGMPCTLFDKDAVYPDLRDANVICPHPLVVWENSDEPTAPLPDEEVIDVMRSMTQLLAVHTAARRKDLEERIAVARVEADALDAVVHHGDDAAVVAAAKAKLGELRQAFELCSFASTDHGSEGMRPVTPPDELPEHDSDAVTVASGAPSSGRLVQPGVALSMKVPDQLPEGVIKAADTALGREEVALQTRTSESRPNRCVSRFGRRVYSGITPDTLPRVDDLFDFKQPFMPPQFLTPYELLPQAERTAAPVTEEEKLAEEKRRRKAHDETDLRFGNCTPTPLDAPDPLKPWQSANRACDGSDDSDAPPLKTLAQMVADTEETAEQLQMKRDRVAAAGNIDRWLLFREARRVFDATVTPAEAVELAMQDNLERQRYFQAVVEECAAACVHDDAESKNKPTAQQQFTKLKECVGQDLEHMYRARADDVCNTRIHPGAGVWGHPADEDEAVDDEQEPLHLLPRRRYVQDDPDGPVTPLDLVRMDAVMQEAEQAGDRVRMYHGCAVVHRPATDVTRWQFKQRHEYERLLRDVISIHFPNLPHPAVQVALQGTVVRNVLDFPSSKFPAQVFRQATRLARPMRQRLQAEASNNDPSGSDDSQAGDVVQEVKGARVPEDEDHNLGKCSASPVPHDPKPEHEQKLLLAQKKDEFTQAQWDAEYRQMAATFVAKQRELNGGAQHHRESECTWDYDLGAQLAALEEINADDDFDVDAEDYVPPPRERREPLTPNNVYEIQHHEPGSDLAVMVRELSLLQWDAGDGQVLPMTLSDAEVRNIHEAAVSRHQHHMITEIPRLRKLWPDRSDGIILSAATMCAARSFLAHVGSRRMSRIIAEVAEHYMSSPLEDQAGWVEVARCPSGDMGPKRRVLECDTITEAPMIQAETTSSEASLQPMQVKQRGRGRPMKRLRGRALVLMTASLTSQQLVEAPGEPSQHTNSPLARTKSSEEVPNAEKNRALESPVRETVSKESAESQPALKRGRPRKSKRSRDE